MNIDESEESNEEGRGPEEDTGIGLGPNLQGIGVKKARKLAEKEERARQREAMELARKKRKVPYILSFLVDRSSLLIRCILQEQEELEMEQRRQEKLEELERKRAEERELERLREARASIISPCFELKIRVRNEKEKSKKNTRHSSQHSVLRAKEKARRTCCHKKRIFRSS